MSEEEYTSIMQFVWKNPDKVKAIRFIGGKPADDESAKLLEEYHANKTREQRQRHHRQCWR